MDTVRMYRKGEAPPVEKVPAASKMPGNRIVWALLVVLISLALVLVGFSYRIEAFSALGFIPLAGGIIYLNVALWSWLFGDRNPKLFRNGYDHWL